MIRSAKTSIAIESPYFLPGYILRKLLMEAARRGVDVTIITPKQSDVTMVDIVRSKYLGLLYKSGINLQFYLPYNLHAKLVMVDGTVFSVGSSNFDYRSFRYMHEVMLFGKDKAMIQGFQQHITETLLECEEFDYPKWLRRPMMHKVFEALLIPLRHFL
jgi:cardiolipin synthase